MAKLTFLQLVNRGTSRLTQATATDVTTLSGQVQVFADAINEAQNELFKEENWYSLYATRKWKTIVYTASTIAAVSGTPDTFTDSDSGFVTAGFQDGQQILTSGFDDSDDNSTWTLASSSGVAAGTLTLQTADTLVDSEAAGNSISITAITYPVASDFGRAIDLLDMTNNHILIEDTTRNFDMDDPDADYTGPPSHFTIDGGFYRIHPIVAQANLIRERYIKIPTALSANTDTSDLPVECENCLIQFALATTYEYLNKFDNADRAWIKYGKFLSKAKEANAKIINKTRVIGKHNFIDGVTGIRAPRFPSHYPRTY